MNYREINIQDIKPGDEYMQKKYPDEWYTAKESEIYTLKSDKKYFEKTYAFRRKILKKKIG